MKRTYFYLIILLLGMVVFLPSCKKKNDKNQIIPIVLDSNSVRAFAYQFEQMVIREDSASIISLFDKLGIKDSLKNNSLINSSFDADFGNVFLDAYFVDIEKTFSAAIREGGDFKFIKYYAKEGKHHIITRLYNDYTLRIDDWIVDTVNNSLKITDAFFYNLSSTLINSANYSLQYQILEYTNPDGITSVLSNAKNLLLSGQDKQVLKLLKSNKTDLQEYPFYWQLYLRALYENDYLHFVSNFDTIIAPHFDMRSVTLHKLIFYANNAMIDETEQCINEMISSTADDPIYLFFYASALIKDKEYEQALICFQNLEGTIPMIWDIWCAKLECFYYLDDKVNFQKVAIQAKKLYNMPEEELMQFIDNHFPAMKNMNFSEKNS